MKINKILISLFVLILLIIGSNILINGADVATEGSGSSDENNFEDAWVIFRESNFQDLSKIYSLDASELNRGLTVLSLNPIRSGEPDKKAFYSALIKEKNNPKIKELVGKLNSDYTLELWKQMKETEGLGNIKDILTDPQLKEIIETEIKQIKGMSQEFKLNGLENIKSITYDKEKGFIIPETSNSEERIIDPKKIPKKTGRLEYKENGDLIYQFIFEGGVGKGIEGQWATLSKKGVIEEGENGELFVVGYYNKELYPSIKLNLGTQKGGFKFGTPKSTPRTTFEAHPWMWGKSVSIEVTTNNGKVYKASPISKTSEYAKQVGAQTYEDYPAAYMDLSNPNAIKVRGNLEVTNSEKTIDYSVSMTKTNHGAVVYQKNAVPNGYKEIVYIEEKEKDILIGVSSNNAPREAIIINNKGKILGTTINGDRVELRDIGKKYLIINQKYQSQRQGGTSQYINSQGQNRINQIPIPPPKYDPSSEFNDPDYKDEIPPKDTQPEVPGGSTHESTHINNNVKKIISQGDNLPTTLPQTGSNSQKITLQNGEIHQWQKVSCGGPAGCVYDWVKIN